jgi:very-short-patch-repair endonuclease
MPIRARIPAELAYAPFRGSTATRGGLITEAMLRGQSWRRLVPDVYLHRDVPATHRVWCEAVGLILPPGSAIGGLSAAHLWGIDLLEPDAPVSIIVPRTGWRPQTNRIIVHHTVIDRGDLTTVGDLPVCTPERTAFDLGRRLGRTTAVIMFDAMLRQEVVDLAAVRELAQCRHWWPKVPQLRKVIELADRRAESPMETRLRLLLLDAGVLGGRPQYEVLDVHGRLVGRVDLGWPVQRLAVEYEGDHHRERDQFRRDIDRINALRAVGWTVLRLTADDVIRRPRETAMMVAAALAERR